LLNETLTHYLIIWEEDHTLRP